MASWTPYANGFEGVVKQREGRYYILWDGYVDGEARTKRLRVNEDTKNRLIEELEEEE